MEEKERERDKVEERSNRRRIFEELRPSAFARVAPHGTERHLSRTNYVAKTRTSRDAIVGKLQDPKSRHSYLKKNKKKQKKKSLFLTLSTSSSLSCSCTRDSHVHVCFTNYTYARNYTHERLYTQSKKKRETL